jgi:DNA adenine methylase
MTPMMRGLTPPIAWYGGKVNLAPLIVSLMPAHTTYVEAFGGAGAVLMFKSPSPVEVYADVHEGLVSLYAVLRDPSLFADFQRRCELTPYSRLQHDMCRRHWHEEDDLVMKAWSFFVTLRQSFSSNGGNGIGSWSYCVGQSRRGMSGVVSKWLTAIEGLPDIHARLRGVQVEQGSWRDIIPRYDTSETLFYLDPPYVLETRRSEGYEHELSLEEHYALTEHLLCVRGMVILSGYRHEGVHGPLEAKGWARYDATTRCWSTNPRQVAESRPSRTESLWSNPAAVAARSQPSLFGLEENSR